MCLKRIGSFLIAVALLAGTVGCGSESYTLTIFSSAGGAVVNPGEGAFIYGEGTVVNLVAEADEGYYFVNWTGDVSNIANVNAVITTIIMNDSYEITANFDQIPPGQFGLTVSSTSGGLVNIPGEATFTYDEGAVVDLVAETEEGYRFVNWTGDVGTIANVEAATTNITMNGDYSITANFVALYDLTISSTTGGSVATPGEGTSTYDEGTVVNLVAEVDESYRFVNWTGDVETIGNVNAAMTTITMNGNYYIIANFEEIPEYDLTLSSTEGGSVTSPGEGTLAYDEETVVILLAKAEEGYYFANWSGDVGTITNIKARITAITIYDNYSITANFEPGYMPVIATGSWHTVGLKSDSTVVAVGNNEYGQCNITGWTGIVQVAAGWGHTVGLKADGTVVAAGWNDYGQCNVGGWTHIIQVDASCFHTVGLKSDDTVVAVGRNNYGQCNVNSWTDIIQVSADYGDHTVGLQSDGTVVAVGRNDYGQCNVNGWTGIIQVSAGGSHTVGLKSDGTVIAVGRNDHGQCNVSGWTDIIQIATGGVFTVGLKSDGTVVAVGWNDDGQCNVSGWTDIIQISAGGAHTVGLKSNGTLVAVGQNYHGQCNVGGWDLN